MPNNQKLKQTNILILHPSIHFLHSLVSELSLSDVKEPVPAVTWQRQHDTLDESLAHRRATL